MSLKQQRFVQEYLIDLNATQAAIRAGYSEKTATEQGHQLLQKTSVQKAINKAQAERAERTKIDQDWVLKRLALLADAKTTDFTAWDAAGVHVKDSDELTPEQAYLVSEITLDETIKESGGGEELVLKRQKRLKGVSDATKSKALELIGKHLGMFGDRLKISGDPNAPLTGVEIVFKKPDT